MRERRTLERRGVTEFDAIAIQIGHDGGRAAHQAIVPQKDAHAAGSESAIVSIVGSKVRRAIAAGRNARWSMNSFGLDVGPTTSSPPSTAINTAAQAVR